MSDNTLSRRASLFTVERPEDPEKQKQTEICTLLNLLHPSYENIYPHLVFAAD